VSRAGAHVRAALALRAGLVRLDPRRG
jgi:hypothetical protein